MKWFSVNSSMRVLQVPRRRGVFPGSGTSHSSPWSFLRCFELSRTVVGFVHHGGDIADQLEYVSLRKPGMHFPFPCLHMRQMASFFAAAIPPNEGGARLTRKILISPFLPGKILQFPPLRQSTNCHDLYDGLVMAQGAPLAKQFTFSERGGSGLVGTVRTFPPHPPTRARKDVEGDEVDVGTLSQNSLSLSLSVSLSLRLLACVPYRSPLVLDLDQSCLYGSPSARISEVPSLFRCN